MGYTRMSPAHRDATGIKKIGDGSIILFVQD